MSRSLLELVRHFARRSPHSVRKSASQRCAIFEPVEARRMLTVHAYVPSGGDIQAATMQAWNARGNLNDRDVVVHLSGGGSYDVDLGYGSNDRMTLGSSSLNVSSFRVVADQGNTDAFANIRIIDAGEKGDPNLTFSSFYNTYSGASASTAASAYNALPFGPTVWIDVAWSGTVSGQRNVDVHLEGLDVKFAYRRADGSIVDGREVNLELRPNIARPAKPDSSVPSDDPRWSKYNIWNYFYTHVQLDGNLVTHHGIGSLEIVNSRVTGGGKNVIAEGFAWGTSVAKIPLVRLERVIVRDAYRWNADRLDFPGFHPAGIYIAQTDRIEIIDSVIAHNGWRRNADGSIPAEYAANGWSHGAYIQGDNTFGNALIRNSTFVDNASEGVQLRSGGTVEDSLFVGNGTGGFFTRGTLTRSAFFEQTDLGRTGNLNAADKGGGWSVNAYDPPRSGPMVLSNNVFAWKAGGANFQGPINNNVNASSVSYSGNYAWSYGSKSSYQQHSAYVYTGPGLGWLSSEPASRSAYPGGGMRAAIQRSEDRGRSGYAPGDSAREISEFYRASVSGGPVQFDEAGGRVDFEAESYHASQGGSGTAAGSAWVDASDSGASGESMLRADPNTGVNALDTTVGPRRDYRIDFTNTGIYYVWVRLNGATGEDDSVHVGLDGSLASSGGGLTLISSQRGTGWKWTNSGPSRRITVNVGTGGVHTFNLWMREDGSRVDQVILTRDFSFVPGGGGPAYVEVQAEAFTGQQSGSGSASASTWSLINDASAGGSKALVANPDTGVNMGDATSGPRRDYAINLDSSGTWYVWVRMKGADGTDDSLHVGLGGALRTTGGGVSLASGQPGAGWHWRSVGPGGARVTVNVSSAGTHMLNLWMREDGTMVDRFILTRDAGFVPS